MSEKQPPPGAARFLEIFEEGKRFTEELLKENEKLRLLIAKLREEKNDLEQGTRHAEVRQLVQKVEYLETEVARLRRESTALRNQFASVEEENREFAERHAKLERQNSDLISMYVATYRLHATLDFGEVVRTINEIVINLVGAEVFGVYLVDETSRSLVLVAQEGLEPNAPQTVPLGEGPMGEAAAAGTLWVAPVETDLQANSGSPIVAIPLKMGDRVIGLIALFQLLVQKESFGKVDYELFELLGGHAATALYVANVYAVSERKRSTLEGFIGLLKVGA